jgi:four helix bundle protein
MKETYLCWIVYPIKTLDVNHNFKELKVWQKSRNLTKRIYQETKDFPKVEMIGIVSQMRRSAISIVSNIAEGCGRNTDKQLKRYLEIAHGSATELEAQLIISKDLGYMKEAVFIELEFMILEIQKMTLAFHRSLKY